jgi:hypothetical protein
MDNRKKVYEWIDPPGGWKYGFPKSLPGGFEPTDENIMKFLIDNGYPHSEITLALRHSRMGFKYDYGDTENER